MLVVLSGVTLLNYIYIFFDEPHEHCEFRFRVSRNAKLESWKKNQFVLIFSLRISN